MFTSRFFPSFGSQSNLARGMARACLVVALATLAFGCARKTTQTTAQTGAETAASASMHDADGRYTIDPNRQIRWQYEVLPNPEPSSKPNYLLKSYTCTAGSAALNNEARGSLADLVEILRNKPSIRVLCLGLCDGVNEKMNATNLGMNRAQGARQYLISKGIAKNRTEASTFGSTQSKAPAGETIGQKLDRRVEIWLLTE